MSEYIYWMLNNKWVVAIGIIIAMFYFLVLPEIKAERKRMQDGKRPFREATE